MSDDRRVRPLACGWCGRTAHRSYIDPAARLAMLTGTIERYERTCPDCGAEHIVTDAGRLVLARGDAPPSGGLYERRTRPQPRAWTFEAEPGPPESVESYTVRVHRLEPIGRAVAYDPHTRDVVTWGRPPSDPAALVRLALRAARADTRT